MSPPTTREPDSGDDGSDRGTGGAAEADGAGHKQMDWTAVAAIAELLGALGVIASLIYLATQVRSGTREARHAAARSVHDKISALLRTISESASLADAYARSTKGWDHLRSEGEMMQVSTGFLDLLRSYEELVSYRDEGLIDDAAWHSTDALVRSVISSKGFADWWSFRADWFSSDFRRRVEAALPEVARDITEEHRAVASRGPGGEGRAS